MIKHSALWLLLPMSVAATTVQAEVIRIPVGQQDGVSQVVDKPTLGMTQDGVLQHYGEPAKRYAAVGEPPISRWQYESFTVYFESGIVMHSVVQHQPKADPVDEASEDTLQEISE